MFSRRRLVQASALAATVSAPLGTRAQPTAAPALPDLSFLKTERLMNEDRARFFMEQEGIDAIVVTRPQNVFYLTNHWPQLDRMGFSEAGFAIFSRDPRSPLALVMTAFLYYYTHSPESGFDDRLIFPYTSAAEPSEDPAVEPVATVPRSRRVRDPELVTQLNRDRFAKMAAAEGISADPSWALAKALKELKVEGGRLGIDDPIIAELISERGLTPTLMPVENTLRRIRLAKSPAELKLMRHAAQANVGAAVATMEALREVEDTRQLRARFYAEAALRGNLGVYMVINSTSSEVVNEPIVDGMAFSIDCVSTCRFYHGDFARTIFVGEPPKQVKKITDATAIAWREVQSQLKPGLRFADIPRIGKASLRKQGVDFNVSFTPHSVGLYHTDHPQPSLARGRSVEGLKLEENMILSVDCPALEAGVGGTTHLEDLMLITKTGAEPIHDVPPGTFTV